MKPFLLRLKRPGLVAAITLMAILLANLFNYFICIYFHGEFTRIDFLKSTFIPLMLAPMISWYLVGATFKLAVTERELKKLTTYDSLTQLFSRTAFLQRAEKLLQTANSEKKPFCIMALDLDYFKKINDNFGHDAGDYVLYKFGQLIKNLGISNHVCGRIGGEEFAFALIDMDIEDSQQFAELVRKKLANTILIYDSKEIKLTTSIGISSYQENLTSLNELMVQADKALYQAKRNGRNQTVTFTQSLNFKDSLQSPS
ncbi:GGDEF domain-containing protein [Kangiella sp. TOML190]|uniref:GGDEF domain-containing protein n=1 Tax=Kangiella sp. TOML190 TaxID=2931351 RepID=UPI00203D2779|nr:GGDEF domain-containing protein [Kangiella sp. TOML190]